MTLENTDSKPAGAVTSGSEKEPFRYGSWHV